MLGGNEAMARLRADADGQPGRDVDLRLRHEQGLPVRPQSERRIV